MVDESIARGPLPFDESPSPNAPKKDALRYPPATCRRSKNHPSRQPPAARWPPMSFLVPWQHVVVFSAEKRQNRRFGAGEEEVVALEATKGFLRPGLLLVAMELKSFKMPFCAPGPAPNRRFCRFRSFFPTR